MTNETNNEINVVKSKILSMVASLENIDAERDQIKSVAESLKADHGIEPRIARKAAKIIHKNTIQDVEDEIDQLNQLLEKVR